MYRSGITRMPLSERDWTRTIGSGQLCTQFISSAREKERERGQREREGGERGECKLQVPFVVIEVPENYAIYRQNSIR